jgi:hypothetical protein
LPYLFKKPFRKLKGFFVCGSEGGLRLKVEGSRLKVQGLPLFV